MEIKQAIDYALSEIGEIEKTSEQNKKQGVNTLLRFDEFMKHFYPLLGIQ